jgi:acyl-coenzyme A thioesterase PaaI-like protein
MHEDGSEAERPAKASARLPLQSDYDIGALAAEGQSRTSLLLFSRRHAPLNPNCVVCGADNQKGLQLEFQGDPNGVDAVWVPTEEWESFRGTVHGGIITAVLDEAMSKAVIARNWEALTVDLRVRFRGRVSPGEELRVHGWVVEKRKRRVLTEAILVTGTGIERAHAWAAFLVPRG